MNYGSFKKNKEELSSKYTIQVYSSGGVNRDRRIKCGAAGHLGVDSRSEAGRRERPVDLVKVVVLGDTPAMEQFITLSEHNSSLEYTFYF